eukprot:TRINITY_DN40992_c0_g1_i2.p1 TRINITY_DN40992_c0_g1~~TRINITY_DN40992_c0_g1_i2.p1  ORF type:complete len:278 (-),score=99.55 TRINITY_DN40992_c0_g1_i2:114-947(-)
MKLLHSVGLIKVEMENEGLAYLADALPKMRAIRRINVSRNHVRSEGFRDFSKYLCSSSSQIESFDVSYNRKLGDVSFIRFCESLRTFCESRHHEMHETQGKDETGEKGVEEAGVVCVGLKSMEWRECGLSNDMMEPLGELLRVHHGLVDIDIRENEGITFGGIKSLLKVLFDTSKTKRKIGESKMDYAERSGYGDDDDERDQEEEEEEIDEKKLLEEWGRVIRISQFTIDTGSVVQHVENMHYSCRVVCSSDHLVSFYIHPPPCHHGASSAQSSKPE